jgi:secreted PhoX family phosphatase
MAAFYVNGELRLVRNHEIRMRRALAGAAIANPAYDPSAAGGTTTLIIDPTSRTLMRDFVSLSGTLVNCAGGATPWGSWLSCEETVVGTTLATDDRGRRVGGFERDHGYVFEVKASADGPETPTPLRTMGRFVHEAVAVDANTGIVYETEDNRPAGFYRFLPSEPGKLMAGGRLQKLSIRGRVNYDTRRDQLIGQRLPIAWIDILDPDPPSAHTNALAVFDQGFARGGAVFARLEGACFHGGDIIFSATDGGNAQRGQVWRYRDQRSELTLLFESTRPEMLNSPDNICVSPRGGIVLCEDSPMQNYLRGLTPDGEIFDFARNVTPGFESHEFAGATFSPDGETLFVNIQRPGLTLAVWGPWHDGAL